jgi:hypothetical protein
MRHFLLLMTASLSLFMSGPAAAGEVTFYPVEVFVDSGERLLSAYQIEFTYDGSAVSVVGIEGGAEPFDDAPYYDPAGMTGGRIVIAAFTTDENPPRGRVRVARLHGAEEGRPGRKFRARLIIAAGPDGAGYEAWAETDVQRGGDDE